MRPLIRTTVIGAAAAFLAACADQDNPTALADLNLATEFEVPGHVHSMTTAEIHVHVRDGGAPVPMHRLELDVVPPAGAATRTVLLEKTEDGFKAGVHFYAPGEHHLQLRGQPAGHHLMRDLGEREVHVARTHIVLGEHRFELETNPAPILAGGVAMLNLFAYELAEEGGKGHEAEGLHLEGTLAAPGGTELPIVFDEHGHGEYRGQVVFPVAGTYGLQIALVAEDGHGDGHGDEHGDEEEHDEGEHSEFHIRVPSLAGDQPAQHEEEGDDGHGH